MQRLFAPHWAPSQTAELQHGCKDARRRWGSGPAAPSAVARRQTTPPLASYCSSFDITPVRSFLTGTRANYGTARRADRTVVAPSSYMSHRQVLLLPWFKPLGPRLGPRQYAPR